VSEIKENELTLEDVELAIKILEIFLKRMEKARSVMRKLGAFYSDMYRLSSFEDFLRAAMMAAPQTTPQTGTTEEIELTPEERQRLERLKTKYIRKE